MSKVASNICESKVFYDTEFEASLAVAHTENAFKSPMKTYRCGTHYHIANVIKQLRSSRRPFNRTYCEACSAYMKPTTWDRHITRAGHKAAMRRLSKSDTPGANLALV